MSNSKELIELAERCEAATGPNRELNIEIALAVWPHAKRRTGKWASTELDIGGGWFNAPFYTASLDAAMSLVPEGWYWQVGQGNHAWAAVYENPIAPSMRVDPIAAAPALALCAAALRARATQSVSEDDTHDQSK